MCHPCLAAIPGPHLLMWSHSWLSHAPHAPGDRLRKGGRYTTPTYPCPVSQPLLTWPHYPATAVDFPIQVAPPQFHRVSPYPQRCRKDGWVTSSHPLHLTETPVATCPHHACMDITAYPTSAPALAPDDMHLCARCPVTSTTAGYPHDSIWIHSCAFMASHCPSVRAHAPTSACTHASASARAHAPASTIPPRFAAVPSWPAFTFHVPRTQTFRCSCTCA